jgi:predicted DNA-binding transcriptional regulator AlpA
MAQSLKIEPTCIPLLTSAQAAAVVGLSRSSLNKMRVYGSGPNFCKLGRSVRYRSDDLTAWVTERVITSTSDDRAPRRLRDCAATAKARRRAVEMKTTTGEPANTPDPTDHERIAA